MSEPLPIMAVISEAEMVISQPAISSVSSRRAWDTLVMIAKDLAAQVEQLPDAVDVTTSVAKEVEQVTVTMNREAASQYGLTAAAVGTGWRRPCHPL